MDTFEILNYLSDEEKKKIAERVYEEEVRKSFARDFESRSPIIFTDRSTVYYRLLDRYIDNMGLEKTDFIPYFKETLLSEMKSFTQDLSSDPNRDNDFINTIKYRLQRLSEEVIDENKDELKPIIRDKVFKCCNETLLIAFLSDIVRRMNLDKAVKQIIQESEGDKT